MLIKQHPDSKMSSREKTGVHLLTYQLLFCNGSLFHTNIERISENSTHI